MPSEAKSVQSMDTMTVEELRRLPVSVPVVEAGRAFGMQRDAVYRALREDRFPCRTFKTNGRERRVALPDLLRCLGFPDDVLTSREPAA